MGRLSQYDCCFICKDIWLRDAEFELNSIVWDKMLLVRDLLVVEFDSAGYQVAFKSLPMLKHVLQEVSHEYITSV